MTIYRCLSILSMAGLQLFIPQAPWAADRYAIQDLGVVDAIGAAGPNLSGQTAVRSGFVSATSHRITPGGTADGSGTLVVDDYISVNGVNDAEGVLRSINGGATSLGTLTVDDYINVNGVNDAGDVVGSANISFGSRLCRDNIRGLVVDDFPGVTPPFLAPPSGHCPISVVRAVHWSKKNGLRDLGSLEGGHASEAFGINKSGAVVGYSSSRDGIRAFLWTPKSNKMQALPALPGGTFSKAFAINDTELIVGSSGSPNGTRASLWRNGRVQNLETLPGETFSEAHAINSLGSIVGSSRGPAGLRAFLWKSPKGGMQVLPALPGGRFSTASGINDFGEIVGTAESSFGIRAVLWNTGGEPQDLNTMVPLPPDVVLTEAVGINAKGQIVALGRDMNTIHTNHEGTSRVFLLTPSGQ